MEPGQALAKTGFDSFGFKFKEIDPETAQKYGIPPRETGLLVLAVQPKSKASETSIRKGDILKEVNRIRVNSIKEYTDVLQKIKKDNPVQLLFVQRIGGLLVVTFKK